MARSKIATTFAVLSTMLVAMAVHAQSVSGTAAQAPSGSMSAGSAMAAAEVPVNKLDNPEQIKGAGVVDSSGKPIGRVADVKVDSGKASKVKVALTTQDGMGRVASIKAEKLSFDRSKGALVAQLTPAEVSQLAATASAMGPNAAGASAAAGASGSTGASKGQ